MRAELLGAGVPPCPAECTRRSLTRRWTCGSRCSPCIAGCRACTCSWRCRPSTGRVTRPSPSLWRPSGSHAAQQTGATGIKINKHLTTQILRSCSTTERHCIRREFFCDGQTNCVNKTDEVDCTATTQPPINEPGLWEDPGVPFLQVSQFCWINVTPCCFSALFLSPVSCCASWLYCETPPTQETKTLYNQGTRQIEQKICNCKLLVHYPGVTSIRWRIWSMTPGW